MNDLIQRIGNAYDELPYESAAFARTSPEHLRAIAHVFGLQAPAAETARVLELGCAAGGNLVPFAVRCPLAQCIGVDLSAVQIESGRAAVADLGLDNLDLRRMSVTDIGEDFGKFDYIVCHGVYSWVPAEVQQAILRVCKRNLADDGIAYISYNTYPGWKAKEVVRDAMILRGGARSSPREKLAYARGMIEFMHEMARPGSVLKQLLDENAEMIRNGRPSYLAHEFLELCNTPCYFHQFMQAANAVGLDYLAESTISEMFVSNYGERAAAALLRECADQRSLEQMLDFVNNRTFRQTLLMHAGRKPSYRVDRERLLDLHIAGSFAIDADAGADAAAATGSPLYRASHNQRTFQVNNAAARETLQALNAASPGTVAVRALVERIAEGSEALARTVLDTVDFLLVSGSIRSRVSPVVCGRADNDRPLMVPKPIRRLVEHRARTASQVGLFNVWHDALPELGPVDLALLPLLDGLHSRERLVAEVLERNAQGAIRFLRDGVEISELAARETAAAEHVEAALQRFERWALLQPRSAPKPQAPLKPEDLRKKPRPD